MLIRFEVANFRSILDPVELSMVAVDRDREEARPVENLGESLLPVAAVYGPNASGKSNVLDALAWIRDAVGNSLRQWDDEVPVEPFAFADGPHRPMEFTVESVVDGVRFEYGAELDRAGVRYEGLFHYPARRRRLVFEREDTDFRLQRGLGHLTGTRELLTPLTLALSIARRFDEPLVRGFARELLAVQALGPRSTGRRPLRLGRNASTASWFDPESRHPDNAAEPTDNTDPVVQTDRARALALLRVADLGITDVEVERRKLSGDSGPSLSMLQIRLIHEAGGELVPFKLSAESEGTQTWFELIGPVLNALSSGSSLLFDELDASLHPTLSAELIRLFRDPTTNPRGAQLIFTTHDTSLLNHLNRDEVWLTEKDEKGMTRLGALAEFAGERVRRSQNIERAYLHGRFGALPDIDRAGVLRALGLTG